MHHFFQTSTANLICRKICVDRRPKNICNDMYLYSVALLMVTRDLLLIQQVHKNCGFILLMRVAYTWLGSSFVVVSRRLPKAHEEQTVYDIMLLIIGDSTVMTSTAVCTVQFISTTHMITHLRHKVHLLVSNIIVSTSMVILKKVSIIINTVNPL